jgi:hypothetical protein
MDLTQLRPSESARLRELDGLEPELRIPLGLLHVNMPRFLSLAAKEEKAKVVNA